MNYMKNAIKSIYSRAVQREDRICYEKERNFDITQSKENIKKE